MTTRNYSSTAVPTTLSAACSDTATGITVSATTGFPAAPFALCLDLGTAAQELVLVTNVAGLSLTVTRGFDSTVATAHAAGAVVTHTHAAIDFRDSRQHEVASSGVHGLTGTLVGTSDSQTITNKNLQSGTNLFPSSLATVTSMNTAVSGGVSTHAALTTGVHGVGAGNVVSTTIAQALANKDLTDPTNTFPASLATVTSVLSGVQALSHKDLTDPTNTFPASVVNPTDTGWVPLTFSTSAYMATPSNGYPPAYRKVGTRVYLRGVFWWIQAGTIPSGSDLCGLPPAITPASTTTLFFATCQGNNTNQANVQIYGDARPYLNVKTVIGTPTWISVDNISYFVD